MIMFDRSKRIDFVTGFKKRKDERRQKAKTMVDQERRQERADLRKTKAAEKQNIEEQYEQLRRLKRAELGLPEDEPEPEKTSAKDGESGSDAGSQSEEDLGMFEKV